MLVAGAVRCWSLLEGRIRDLFSCGLTLRFKLKNPFLAVISSAGEKSPLGPTAAELQAFAPGKMLERLYWGQQEQVLGTRDVMLWDSERLLDEHKIFSVLWVSRPLLSDCGPARTRRHQC